MITTDRMGSFISAQMIFIENISSYQVIDGKVKLIPDSINDIIKLDPVKNGIKPNVTPVVDQLGLIYEISVNITLKTDISANIIPFNECLLLLTDPKGNITVYGTPQFPLSVTRSIVTADNPAGYSGYVLAFSGKQTFIPLPV